MIYIYMDICGFTFFFGRQRQNFVVNVDSCIENTQNCNIHVQCVVLDVVILNVPRLIIPATV